KPPKTIAPAALQDVPPSHWAYNSIQTVLRHGVMTGYREGRFFPDQRVTRAEAFSIFAQSYGVFQFPEETVTAILTKYPDAKEVPSWARKSLATALYEGFINTEPANQIRPLQPMTRGDMAYALSKYLDIQGQTTGFLQGR
ncbi:MAG: S-layer homology domain-containing protein, partial [Leptolyngbyaceae bacterium]|nr:S-layer homology domain-containing protein [Leptolyngbyaceae bacterium]